MLVFMERFRVAIVRLAQHRFALFVVPVVAFGLLFTPVAAFAEGFTDMILRGILLLVSWLIMDLYIPLMGSLMTMFMQLIVRIAMYNSFGTATAVTIGWVLLRDITNMLLVVILLSMAFGTLLNQEKLGTYKQLPLFAVIAVMINFSKMITLLIIDVSQVVMLSFVAAFQNTAAGNFVRAFGIRDWFTLENISASGDYKAQAAVAMALAAILVTVATVVLLVFLLYLIIRIVMLWLLIMFSPLAFGLKLVPGKGKAQYDLWWKHLIETLIVGPLLAFFLWLTLIVAGVSNGAIGSEVLSDSTVLTSAHNAEVQNSGAASELQIKSRKGAALTPDTLITFFLTICMLLLGMKISIEAGGVAGGAAKKYGVKGARFAGRKAMKIAGWGGKRVASSLYNAPIVRGGGSIKDVFGHRVADPIKKSATYRALGLDKDHTEKVRRMQKMRYLEARGDKAGAQRLRHRVLGDERKGLEGLTSGQLRQKFNKAEGGSVEQEAALLEMSKSGMYENDIAGLKKDAKNSGIADMESRMLRQHIGTAKAAKQFRPREGQSMQEAVQERVVDAPKKERQEILANIHVAAQKGIDSSGNETPTRGDHVDAVLNGLTKNSVAELSGGRQKDIQKALLNRARNSTGAEREGFQNKFAELFDEQISLDADGSVVMAKDASGANDVSAERLSELQRMSNEQRLEENARLQDARLGVARAGYSKGQTENQIMLEGRGNMERDTRRGLDGELAKLTRITPAKAGGYSAAASQVEAQQNELAGFYSDQDALRGTDKVDGDGKKITHDAAFKNSSINKDMTELSGAYRHRQRLEDQGASAEQIAAQDDFINQVVQRVNAHASQIRGGSGVSGRMKQVNQDLGRKLLSNSMSSVSSHMSAVESAGSQAEQKKALNDVVNYMETALAHAEKASDSDGVADAIVDVRKQIREHKKNRGGADHDDNMRVVGELNKLVKEVADNIGKPTTAASKPASRRPSSGAGRRGGSRRRI